MRLGQSWTTYKTQLGWTTGRGLPRCGISGSQSEFMTLFNYNRGLCFDDGRGGESVGLTLESQSKWKNWSAKTAIFGNDDGSLPRAGNLPFRGGGVLRRPPSARDKHGININTGNQTGSDVAYKSTGARSISHICKTGPGWTIRALNSKWPSHPSIPPSLLHYLRNGSADPDLFTARQYL